MKGSIKYPVCLLAFVPTLILSLLLGTYFISIRSQDIEERLCQYGESMALKLALDSEYGVFTRNTSILQDLARQTLHQANIQSVSFYHVTGKQLALAGKSLSVFSLPNETENLDATLTLKKNPDHIVLLVPIKVFKETDYIRAYAKGIDNLVGWLKLELNTQSIRLDEHKLIWQAALLCLLSLILSGLLAFWLERTVTRPIEKIADSVGQIKQGKLNTRIKISTYRELELLASGINLMTEDLESAHTELHKKIEQSLFSLRRTLETIEVQNIELEIARRTAENANKVKSEFLVNMSHEIRTPLNGVIGFTNLLAKTELTQKQAEYVLIVQKSAHNLLAIINDVLDFSKIETGNFKIDRTRMDIRACVTETLNLLAAHAQEKNLSLIPLIYSDVPIYLMGDPLRLKQIITNLVNNAIKFTEQGKVIIRVMLEQDNDPRIILRISVTDTGVGLSADKQKILLQTLNQIKFGSTRRLGGAGLGLVICKKLVEQMGGVIGVESEPQKGATFWFTVQVEKIVDTPNLQPIPSKLPIPSFDLPSSTFKLEIPLKILAVDDNPDNLRLLAILLEDMGAAVTTVDSAEKAIAIIKQQTFQLIFMDIRMPNMNGMTAARIIRQLEVAEHRNRTPIIALTAHALENEKKELLEAGIDDYLAKPLNESEFKLLIQRWVHPSDTQTAIDWELSKKLAGGRMELAQEFLEKLIAALPQEKTQINENFFKKDWNTLRNNIHKLHGACCYCGVPQLKQCTQKLESVVETHTLETIQPYLKAFNKAVDAVLAESTTIPV